MRVDKDFTGVLMGRIKTKWVKTVARELVEKHPEKFSTDFINNKKSLDAMDLIEDKIIRNKVAGCIVRIVGKNSRVD